MTQKISGCTQFTLLQIFHKIPGSWYWPLAPLGPLLMTHSALGLTIVALALSYSSYEEKEKEEEKVEDEEEGAQIS